MMVGEMSYVLVLMRRDSLVISFLIPTNRYSGFICRGGKRRLGVVIKLHVYILPYHYGVVTMCICIYFP